MVSHVLPYRLLNRAGPGKIRLHWVRQLSAGNALKDISSERLSQLLEAEITHLSYQQPKPLTLQSVLAYNQEERLDELCKFLYEELPVRFAHRIKLLESLPGWEKDKLIERVHKEYVQSVKDLRTCEPEDPKFLEQLQLIKVRHGSTTSLVQGFHGMKDDAKLSEAEINEWLDKFFVGRMATNMLMSHCLRKAKESNLLPKGDNEEFFPTSSFIEPECDPCQLAIYAADTVKKLSMRWYKIAPGIEVVDHRSQCLPFVPSYLLFILSELLKNAVRATVESHQDRPGGLPPVKIIVSGDDKFCIVRMSDEGGGIRIPQSDNERRIPQSDIERVWSWLYSTAPRLEEGTAPGRIGIDSPHGVSTDPADRISPLAGLGCGLPLSRLHAKYLGGQIDLHSLPNHGVDVYVYLNRLGAQTDDLYGQGSFALSPLVPAPSWQDPSSQYPIINPKV